MKTFAQIQKAIEQLSAKDKAALSMWLESQTSALEESSDERALLKRLDHSARELDRGEGVPIDDVRLRVRKWAGI